MMSTAISFNGPMTLTLPQLLDRFRIQTATTTDFAILDPIDFTYQSTALEGSTLSLGEVSAILHTGSCLTERPLSDQLRVIDHHQALQEVLSLASQHQPLNRAMLQAWAATLSRQTGETVHTLLGSYDTGRGELRTDRSLVSRRKLIDARKLPAVLDAMVKEINATLPQLKTPRQRYDFSFTVHFRLLTLHPFGSGNGPVARLLMGYLQQFHQLPLSRVYPDSRGAYQAALSRSWQDESERVLVGFMHEQLMRYLIQSLG